MKTKTSNTLYALATLLCGITFVTLLWVVGTRPIDTITGEQMSIVTMIGMFTLVLVKGL